MTTVDIRQELDSIVEETPLEPELRELEKVRTQLSRLAADFANYRNRTRAEAAQCQELGKAAVLTDLLDIADDLERALRASETEPGALRDGVAGVYRRLRRILDKHNVQPIPTVGERFDPTCHEAVSTVPANGVPPDYIAAEHQRGYLINGRLLRPARVVVAKDGNKNGEAPDAVEVTAGDRDHEELL